MSRTIVRSVNGTMIIRTRIRGESLYIMTGAPGAYHKNECTDDSVLFSIIQREIIATRVIRLEFVIDGERGTIRPAV